MKEIKALFVNPGKTAYGSGQSMLGLLENRSFQAEVACPGGGPLEDSLRKMGIKHHPMEFGKRPAFRRPDLQLAFHQKFRRILKASQPDVVVINLDGNTPLVTLAALRLGIPIVRFSRFEFKPPTRWLDKWCWKKASAVVCPSELVKQQVLAWDQNQSRCGVYRLYDPHSERLVSPAEIELFRAKWRLGSSKTITYVGRLNQRKRVETAIHALGAIRQVFPGSCLLIVGSHNGSKEEIHYEHKLLELAIKLGLTDAVHYLGYQERDAVPVVMAASDVCVLPSETESFGMVLTEAWSVRVPTVASDVGGCREITQASGGGLLHPVGDHDALAKHVLKLLSDPALARKHGIAGETWVKANCDSQSYAEQFHHILKQVVKSGRSVSHLSAASPEVRLTESVADRSPEPKCGLQVGIATFYHESHPGAVLQAYALAKTINNLGHRAEMIAYRRPVRDATPSLKQKILRFVTRSSQRDADYLAFQSRFLKESKRQYDRYEDIVSQSPQADAYVCGSDQIWNPALLAGNKYDPAYFLQFGSAAIPRISYAASFGGHRPDGAQAGLLRKYLGNFSHISVREAAGQSFLKQLLGREVALTLDPTLLLENYNELLPVSTGGGRYILLYGLQYSPEIQAAAKTVAACLNQPLWSCGGPVLPWKHAGIRKTEEGPLKWLERINGASAVITNSYHGMIFSLLYRKRVIVVPLQGGKNAGNERLLNLCDVLGVREQIMPSDIRSSLSREMDWDAFDSRLAEQRAASLAFLRSALPSVDSAQNSKLG